VEQNRKAGQNPPRVVVPTEEEEEEEVDVTAHSILCGTRSVSWLRS
jgi:hypothetical protein